MSTIYVMKFKDAGSNTEQSRYFSSFEKAKIAIENMVASYKERGMHIHRLLNWAVDEPHYVASIKEGMLHLQAHVGIKKTILE